MDCNQFTTENIVILTITCSAMSVRKSSEVSYENTNCF